MADDRQPTAESCSVRLGLRYVKGLREEAARAMVRERAQRPFVSIDDLARRVPELRKNELVTLAQIGALNSVLSSQFSVLRKPVASGQLSVASVEAHGFSRAQQRQKNFRASAPEGAVPPGLWPSLADPTQDFRPGLYHAVAEATGAAAAGNPVESLSAEIDKAGNPVETLSAEKLETGNSGLETGNSKLTGHWPLTTGHLHRRDALWQVERAARATGPLLEEIVERDSASPLTRMSNEERLVADFRGTGLTVGRHPMAYRRAQLRGVLRACDLPSIKNGRRVRIAGSVIARQRPGTARGFVFLSLEDETGIANAIIKPDLFEKNRLLLIREPFLLIEGTLQNLDNVLSVKAERVRPLQISSAAMSSHDFH